MKELIFAMLICPLISNAQKPVPRFENDTLYTSSGYKIYKDLTLQFGNGTGDNGNFRYIDVKSGKFSYRLANRSFIVKKLRQFENSVFRIGRIELVGSFIFKDGTKTYMEIMLIFDKAIENELELPGELIVPAEFRNKQILSIAWEIRRLYELYKKGDISKAGFESQKKKLLEQ
jgi:hypothetical protein